MCCAEPTGRRYSNNFNTNNFPLMIDCMVTECIISDGLFHLLKLPDGSSI